MKEFYSSQSLKTYLNGLSEKGIPFDCLHLRVLPEDIKAKKSPSQKIHLLNTKKVR